MVLGDLDRFDEARRVLTDGVRALPGEIGFHQLLGNITLETGALSEGLRAFDEMLRISPGHVDALAGRALTLSWLGRHEEALGAFDRLLQLSPGYLASVPDAQAAYLASRQASSSR